MAKTLNMIGSWLLSVVLLAVGSALWLFNTMRDGE